MQWKNIALILPFTVHSWDFSVAVYGGRNNLTESYVIDPVGGSTYALAENQALPGRGRVYHTMEKLGDVAYLIGGQEPNENGSGMTPSDLVYSQSSPNSPWELLGNSKLSSPRARMASTIYDGRIWVCGGRGGAAFESLIICERNGFLRPPLPNMTRLSRYRLTVLRFYAKHSLLWWSGCISCKPLVLEKNNFRENRLFNQRSANQRVLEAAEISKKRY